MFRYFDPETEILNWEVPAGEWEIQDVFELGRTCPSEQTFCRPDYGSLMQMRPNSISGT